MSGYCTQAVWIACGYPGCDAGLSADARHIQNLTAGGWYCDRHDTEDDE